MHSKACRICGTAKPLGEFHRAAGMRDGHRNECRDCFRALSRDRYRRNRERYIAGVKRWQQENSDRLNEYRRARRQLPEVKRQQRSGYYLRTYGVSADDVDAMLEAQGGGCAICLRRPERQASLHLDHDHQTGWLRGVLCSTCNQALGHLRDDPVLIERAVVYLRQRGVAPLETEA